MKTSELKRAIVDHFWNEGRPLTKNFIASLSQKLLQSCELRAEQEDITWTAALHRFVYGEPQCTSCGTSKIKFRNFRDGYGKHCSSKCAGADHKVDEKRKQTNLKVHGVERPQQHLPSVRKKFKRTMQSRYGVTYGGQSRKLQAKAKRTTMHMYGVPYASMSEEVKQRIRQTTLERFGVEHVMQNREVFETQQRSGFKAVEFTIAGKTFKLRGSEHHFVQWLVDKGVSVDNIRTTKAEGVPSIDWYDASGKKHVYHPDAFVKYKGLWYVVEVKSTFTLGLLQHVSGGRSGKFSEVRRKAKACEDAGFRFKLFVVAQDKRKPAHIAMVKNLSSKTKNQVRQELKSLHPGKFRQL